MSRSRAKSIDSAEQIVKKMYNIYFRNTLILLQTVSTNNGVEISKISVNRFGK